MSGAAAEKKPGTLVLAIGGRPKGESYGASKESDDAESGGGASYEAEGQALLDAVKSGDAGAVGDAMRRAAMRCMSEESAEGE